MTAAMLRIGMGMMLFGFLLYLASAVYIFGFGHADEPASTTWGLSYLAVTVGQMVVGGALSIWAVYRMDKKGRR